MDEEDGREIGGGEAPSVATAGALCYPSRPHRWRGRFHTGKQTHFKKLEHAFRCDSRSTAEGR